jgi:hypothetical protein
MSHSSPSSLPRSTCLHAVFMPTQAAQASELLHVEQLDFAIVAGCGNNCARSVKAHLPKPTPRHCKHNATPGTKLFLGTRHNEASFHQCVGLKRQAAGRTLFTGLSPQSRLAFSLTTRTSHSFTIPSASQEAIVSPVKENATPLTALLWP